MTKVWNISDHPGTKTPPASMVLFDETVVPGKGVKVPEGRESALQRMKERDGLHIGDTLPEDYVAATSRVKAERPAGSSAGHAPVLKAPERVAKAKAEKPAKAELKTAPKAKVEEKAEEATVELKAKATVVEKKAGKKTSGK